MPGIQLSSVLITTDTPLLFFLALMIWACVALPEASPRARIWAAAGMQMVGLSPALGAFLAGVVLAESEFRRELETDIEPFRGLLLGLFFITVGAGLNFGLIGRSPCRWSASRPT